VQVRAFEPAPFAMTHPPGELGRCPGSLAVAV